MRNACKQTSFGLAWLLLFQLYQVHLEGIRLTQWVSELEGV